MEPSNILDLVGKKARNNLTKSVATVVAVDENRLQVQIHSKRFEEKFGSIIHSHNTKRTRLSQIGIVIIPYYDFLRNWTLEQ